MAKKLKPKPKIIDNFDQYSKRQRDKRITRILQITIPLIIAIIVIMIAYWGYDNYVGVWRQSVTTVGNTTFDMDYYVKMLRYYSLHDIDIDSERYNFTVLNEIKEKELVKQGAIRQGIEITSGNITNKIDAIITQSLNNLGLGNATQEDKERYHTGFLDLCKISDKEYRNIIEADLFRDEFREYLKEHSVPKETKYVQLYTVEFDTEDEAKDALNQFLEGNNTLANAGNVTILGASNETETFYVEGPIWIPQGIYTEYDEIVFNMNVGDITTINTTLIQVSDINETMSIMDDHEQILAQKAYEIWISEERARLNLLSQYKDYVSTDGTDWEWIIDKATVL